MSQVRLERQDLHLPVPRHQFPCRPAAQLSSLFSPLCEMAAATDWSCDEAWRAEPVTQCLINTNNCLYCMYLWRCKQNEKGSTPEKTNKNTLLTLRGKTERQMDSETGSKLKSRRTSRNCDDTNCTRTSCWGVTALTAHGAVSRYDFSGGQFCYLYILFDSLTLFQGVCPGDK